MRDKLRESYQGRIKLLQQLAENLERETKEALRNLSHIDRAYYRAKAIDSFVDKARDPENKPPYVNPLAEIEDQVAGRVLVFFLGDISAALLQLLANFTEVESRRRRPEKDEEFGYESHHLVCMIPPQVKPPGWTDLTDLPVTFELQIRTLLMHAWAEPQHDLGYKGSHELSHDIRRELFWIAASCWGADQAFERVSKWLQHNTPPKLT